MSKPPSAIADLQDHCHVFAELPKPYLIELQREGAIRGYHLDEDESLIFRHLQDKHEALIVLNGVVEIRRDGERISLGGTSEHHCRMLPLTDIRERMGQFDRSGQYITYCLSGKRSAVAAMILKANGFDVVCMKEGLREWPDPTVTD